MDRQTIEQYMEHPDRALNTMQIPDFIRLCCAALRGLEQAEKQCRTRPSDVAWPLEYIRAKTRPAVDFQYLDANKDVLAASPKVTPLAPTAKMIEAGAQRLVSWDEGCKWPDSWAALQVAAARNEAERVWRSMWLAATCFGIKGDVNNSPYWMIEMSINGVAHWWIRGDGQEEYWNKPARWTTDPSKARHYPTKFAAEFVMGSDMTDCSATEHVDCKVAAEQAEADRLLRECMAMMRTGPYDSNLAQRIAAYLAGRKA